MNVYLSGTITPNSKHNKWRGVFHEQFGLDGHDVYDPMRFKSVADLDAKGYTSKIPASLFVERDYCDIQKSDVMVVVFWAGLNRQSIGTWAEVGWAIAWRIPFIVLTDDADVINHPFIQKWAAQIVKIPNEGFEASASEFAEGYKGVLDAVRFLDKSAL